MLSNFDLRQWDCGANSGSIGDLLWRIFAGGSVLLNHEMKTTDFTESTDVTGYGFSGERVRWSLRVEWALRVTGSVSWMVVVVPCCWAA